MIYRDENTVTFCAEELWESKKHDLGACFLQMAKIKHKAVSGLSEGSTYEMIRFAQEIDGVKYISEMQYARSSESDSSSPQGILSQEFASSHCATIRSTRSACAACPSENTK